MKHTEQTKQKLSHIRKGNKNPFYGKKHTPETLAKIRASCKQNCKGKLDLQDLSIKIPGNLFDIGYLAAIIDGEGSIGIRKNKGAFVAVYNTNKNVIHWLRETVGGSVDWESGRGGRLPCNCWYISAAKNVYAMCKFISPYLKIKKENAEEVITYLENRYGERLNG